MATRAQLLTTPAIDVQNVRSVNWMLIEEVVVELMTFADHQSLDVAVQFVLATLARSDGPCEMSILVDAESGSLAFVDDRFGNAWLAHWPKGAATGQVRILNMTDDSDLLAQQCLEMLIDQYVPVMPRVRAH